MSSCARLLIFSTTLLLTACDASNPVKPDNIVTKTDVVTADKITRVPCVAREDLPPALKPTAIDRATATPEQKAAAVDRDHQAMARYYREAVARFEQCVSDGGIKQ